MNREPERLLTIAQAAEITSYSEAVILDWLRTGLRHCTGKPGRTRIYQKEVRIRLSDLWLWVDQLSVSRATATEQPIAKHRKSASGGRLRAWREQK